MSIACPYCNAVLKTKGAKPGNYTPACPKCGKTFLLTVPEDETGTFRVQPMPQTKPATELPDTVRVPAVKPTVPKPKTDRLPLISTRPPITTSAPGADTAVLVKGNSGTVKPPAPRAPQNPGETPAGPDPDAAIT
jgi:hypothetical protein